jgi:hypothetical protein
MNEGRLLGSALATLNGRKRVFSDFCSLRQFEGVLNVNSKIANGTLDLRMFEQNLNSAQVPRDFVDDRSLCATQRMRAIILGLQANANDPLSN